MNRRTLVAPSLLAAAWWLVAASGLVEPRLVPRPSLFASTALAELSGRSLWVDLAATTARLVAGLALSVPLGGAVGYALGTRAAVWRATAPTVDFLRAIPPILTFPLFVLGLGHGELARLAAVVFGTAGIVTLHVATALSVAPPARRGVARLLGLEGLSLFFHVRFFEGLPGLFTGSRVALAAGLVIVVVTEMLVGASEGLGARALAAQMAYRADLLWVVIALSGALGVALSAIVVAMERRVVHWSPAREEEARPPAAR